MTLPEGSSQPAVEPSSPDPSLASFVDSYQKLISVLGVFIALTLFSRQLPLRFIGDLLSFLFLGATIILWFELQEHFPRKSSHRKLGLFEDCVGLALLALLAYFVLMYRLFWRQGLVMVLWLLLSMGARTLVQKFNVFDRTFNAPAGSRKWLRFATYYLVQGLILTVSLVIAGLVGMPVNRWLDKARVALEQDSTNIWTSPLDPTQPAVRAPVPTQEVDSSASLPTPDSLTAYDTSRIAGRPDSARALRVPSNQRMHQPGRGPADSATLGRPPETPRD